MRFNFSATAILALATSVFAQTADFDPVTSPTKNEVIPAGSTFDITWTTPAKYSSGTVKISLIGGATQGSQVPIMDIATGVKNSAGSYSWAVGSDLGDKAIYGLVVLYEGTDVFQYSNPFHVKAGGSTKPTGSATTTLTKSHGVKTITLESTSTPCPTTTSEAPITTSAAQNTTTIAMNTTTLISTTVAVPTVTSVWTTSAAQTTEAPATSATVSAVPTGAAGQVGAASVAFIGGLVVAVLAL